MAATITTTIRYSDFACLTWWYNASMMTVQGIRGFAPISTKSSRFGYKAYMTNVLGDYFL